ncbi:MAG: hypothetical protein GQ534_10765, partial [Candidatus Delongbacteria bacterium]|nr:hypothetical protein [Candidatus Delongbacteria bacterium]
MKNIKIYLYSYFKKYNSWLLFGGFLALIQSLFLIPMPLVTRRILDTTIVNKNLAELLVLSIIIVFVLFLNKAVVYYKGLIFDRINNKVIFDLRIDLLKKLNKVKINKFKLFGIGYLISRINDDTERLSSLFADAF